MKTYIWDIPTRLIHWLVVILITITAFLGENEMNMNFHYLLGFTVGIVVIIRILYGFFGPTYTNFKDFFFPLNKFKEYITDTKLHFAGHNPMAAIVMILIFLFILLCSISGFLLALTESGLINSVNKGLLEEAHEILPRILYFLIGIHLIGLIVDSLFHPKVKTVLSIVTGYKNMDAKQDESNKYQRVSLLVITILGLIMVYYFNSNILPQLQIEGENTEQNSNEGSETDDD